MCTLLAIEQKKTFTIYYEVWYIDKKIYFQNNPPYKGRPWRGLKKICNEVDDNRLFHLLF